MSGPGAGWPVDDDSGEWEPVEVFPWVTPAAGAVALAALVALSLWSLG